MKLSCVLLSIAAIAATACHAVIPATAVYEVRATGSAQNGGGWVPGSSGTDLSQQDAAQYSVTDAVTSSGLTTVTSASANFQPDVVGNIVFISGGSFGAWQAWFQVTARNSSTSITVDRSSVNSTGATLKIGGALPSPSFLTFVWSQGGTQTAGADAWIKAGTYNIDDAGAATANGKIVFAGSTTNPSVWEGYQTVRGDRGTRPLIFASTIANGRTAIVEAQYAMAINLEVDSNSTNNNCFTCVDNFRVVSCVGRNSAGTGFNAVTADRCFSVSCTSGFQNCPLAYACVAQNSATTGFLSCLRSMRCIDINSTNGFSLTSANSTATNCVCYGGTGIGGFQLGGASSTAINCIVMNRVGKGFTGLTGTNTFIQHCAGFNNSTGNTDATDTTRVQNFITLTADPFVNAAGGNFALNSTSGGGLALKAAGIPGVFSNGTTTSSMNIGAVENSGVASGGGSFVFIQ
jgi:hypothetical protein